MDGLDTDSRMMREQQNQDSASTIEADENEGTRAPSDLDAQSRVAREAAKAGRITDEDQQDAVLRQNRARIEASHGETETSGKPEPDFEASLARRDRSLLGS